MKTPVFNCLLFLFFLSSSFRGTAQSESFNYKKYIAGDPVSLYLYVNSVDRISGDVSVNGVDTRGPGIPFTWIWGDGQVNEGWFPQTHKYADITKNYILKVVSHYSANEKDSCEALIDFVKFLVNPVSLDPKISVIIPSQNVSLGTHHYPPPTNLTFFNDDFFTKFTRNETEYILSVCASIDYDLANNDVFLYDNKFEQYMFRDPAFGGAYSLWFTDPVSFGVGDVFMSGDVDFQSLCHEMGHNFTLNTPADYYFGGKIDGNANAIYSETMAQIFSHSAGYILLNNYQDYGLGPDLAFKLKSQFINSVRFLRTCYENYIVDKKFCSWNNPSTETDETFLTFMTLAFKFIEHAENNGKGYRIPLKNMMSFLQKFNSGYQTGWDQHNNTLQADTFRATYMIASLSVAFQEDLRNEFRMLNFPVSDKLYRQFLPESGIELRTGWNIISFKLLPDSTDMKVIFRPLIHDGSLVKVQDETGNALEDLGVFGGWTNNIGNMAFTEGYKVKVSRACQLYVAGTPAVFPFEIPLKAGWNIMGYPKQAETEAKAVVQQLINRGTLIKVQDEMGNALEDYGVFGGWTNNIGNFKPWEGYKIKVTADDTLILPPEPNGP